MAIRDKLRLRRASRRVSPAGNAALKRQVTQMAETLDALVVQQARVKEELTLLRHEVAVRDVSSDR